MIVPCVDAYLPVRKKGQGASVGRRADLVNEKRPTHQGAGGGSRPRVSACFLTIQRSFSAMQVTLAL